MGEEVTEHTATPNAKRHKLPNTSPYLDSTLIDTGGSNLGENMNLIESELKSADEICLIYVFDIEKYKHDVIREKDHMRQQEFVNMSIQCYKEKAEMNKEKIKRFITLGTHADMIDSSEIDIFTNEFNKKNVECKIFNLKDSDKKSLHSKISKFIFESMGSSKFIFKSMGGNDEITGDHAKFF
ncbi:hypothetical protein [Campylobacter sp. MIT 99-7217]|uniref:hypothetical protein n=1 Tax=Campylobacter sp. MIT 99-7217 TaxID=535091 RepID=UPI003917E6C3